MCNTMHNEYQNWKTSPITYFYVYTCAELVICLSVRFLFIHKKVVSFMENT